LISYDLSPSIRGDDSPVKVELDGGAGGLTTSFAASNQRRTEALFSDAHRSRRTTPVTKATSGRGSSWDDSDSETEVEVVGTIHRSDAPWFFFIGEQSEQTRRHGSVICWIRPLVDSALRVRNSCAGWTVTTLCYWAFGPGAAWGGKVLGGAAPPTHQRTCRGTVEVKKRPQLPQQ
jgi:hypothetical protein